MSGAATPDEDRRTCTPCRGTGTLRSGQGGEPHPVPCPWCGGTGVFTPGRNAQTGETAPAGEGDDV